VATLRDVAERAGVSIRTVSNVVNGFHYVSEATRARVRQAIEETGYQPNLAARSLRGGRSGLIGLIVPEIDVPYFGELTRCFIEQLAGREHTLVVDHTDGDPARERDIVLRRRPAPLFDGLIANPLQLSAEELEAARPSLPLVLIGEQVHSDRFDHVMIDNVRAAREAVQHLLGLGRRRIAVVGGPPDGWTRTTALRIEGYQAALRDAGHRPDPDLDVRTEALHRRDGAVAMERLLRSRRPPDAVFCLNDLVALGVLRTLAVHGVRVPDDIAVTGFDDIEDGRYATPTLSTVAPDKAGIAALAVQRLTARMAGDQSPGATLYADHTFVARESTLGRDAAAEPDPAG